MISFRLKNFLIKKDKLGILLVNTLFGEKHCGLEKDAKLNISFINTNLLCVYIKTPCAIACWSGYDT